MRFDAKFLFCAGVFRDTTCGPLSRALFIDWRCVPAPVAFRHHRFSYNRSDWTRAHTVWPKQCKDAPKAVPKRFYPHRHLQAAKALYICGFSLAFILRRCMSRHSLCCGAILLPAQHEGSISHAGCRCSGTRRSLAVVGNVQHGSTAARNSVQGWPISHPVRYGSFHPCVQS